MGPRAGSRLGGKARAGRCHRAAGCRAAHCVLRCPAGGVGTEKVFLAPRPPERAGQLWRPLAPCAAHPGPGRAKRERARHPLAGPRWRHAGPTPQLTGAPASLTPECDACDPQFCLPIHSNPWESGVRGTSPCSRALRGSPLPAGSGVQTLYVLQVISFPLRKRGRGCVKAPVPKNGWVNCLLGKGCQPSTHPSHFPRKQQ